MYLKQHL